MPSATANFGWLKPDIGASNDQWGSLLNNDLDSIDTQVKANQTAIPAASATLPVMNGAAAVGIGTTWARADHVHATDTACYLASNPSGYQTAAQVTASLGGYVAKTGDTMTGMLTIKPSGTNWAQFILAKSGSGQANQIASYTGATIPANVRWQIMLGDATAESGSNAGSDFSIGSFTDTGAGLSTPLKFTRSTGNAIFSGTVQSNGNGFYAQAVGSGNSQFTLLSNTGAATGYCYWNATNGSVNLLQVSSGGNLQMDNAGNCNVTGPFNAGGQVTSTNNRCTGGYYCQPGLGAANRSNRFNIDWNGSAMQGWVDNTNFGTFAFTSDYRVKTNVEELPSTWDRVKQLRPVSFNYRDFTPDGASEPLIRADVDISKPRWGFIAHEMQETLIMDAATGVKDQKDLIQSPNPWTVIATLTKALQEAMARIEALEAAGA